MRQNNQNQNYLKVGAVCASILCVCYLVIIVLALFSPVSVMTYHVDSRYFSDFNSYKNLFVWLKFMMVIANASLVGVVIAIYKLKELNNHGWLMLFQPVLYRQFSN